MAAPAPDPAIATLADLTRVQARSRPGAPAVVYGDVRLSFEALDAASDRVAQALVAEGLSPGARVAFLDRNSDAFFPILFGAAKAGLVLVTVNFRLAPPEIAYILRDSEAELVFCGGEYLDVATRSVQGLGRAVRLIATDDGGEIAQNLADWSRRHPPRPPAGRAPRPQDGAVQMYTSGTTGHPKGVELSHHAMVRAAHDGLSVWPAMFRPDAAVLATMPLFHIAATNLGIAALFAGGRVEIVRAASAEETIRLIAERKIAVVPLPTAVIHEIVGLRFVKDLDLSHLDTLLIAGSGIPVALLRQAQETLNCGFALSYGMTECCGGLTYLGPADCVPDAGERLKSAGRPLGDNRIRVVGPDGADLPPGEIGEILCQTDRVMTGYWKRPEATAEALKGGWYHSGDAGYLDADGYLYVVDRIKDMVISGGENIYPVEIENALIAHPGVSDVAVIGVPDDKWGESLVACIVPAAGAEPRAEDLQAFLRSRLAGYKIPRRYEVVDAFPRNATGKVLKRVMRETYSGKATP